MASEFKIFQPVVVGSLASDPSASYNGEIYYNTTLNAFRIYANGSWQSLSTGSTGANTSLSNLTTTSINQSLVPSTDNTFDLGGALGVGAAWEHLYAYNVITYLSKSPSASTGASVEYDAGSGQATGTANSGAATLTSGLSSNQSGAVFVQSGGAQSGSGNAQLATGASNTGNTGAIIIKSGIASSGSSGSITLQTGSATGGSQGKIFLGPSAAVNIATQFSADPGSGAAAGDIYYNTSDHSIHLYNGSAWVPLATGGSAANTFLSNLTSPTAINQDMLPASAGAHSLGSQALPWLDVSSEEFDMVDGSGNEIFQITNSSSNVLLSALVSAASLSASTANNTAADATASGSINISTGAKSAGTGNSGDINLSTGTSSGGAQGRIIMVARALALPEQASNPVTAAAGDLYYNSVSNAIMYYNGSAWIQLATGGSAANTTLSNLTSPTAINQDLLPASDASNSLGNSSAAWNNLYVRNIIGDTGVSLALQGPGVSVATNSGTTSQAIQLTTGTASAGASGDIDLTTGSATGGNQGRVILVARALNLPAHSANPASPSSGDTYYNTVSNAILYYNGTSWVTLSTGGGTVTSVAFADASTTPIYGVTGSPVTSTGTLTITLSTQSANSVFAGPSSGAAAQPTFRALVANDIPSLSAIYVTQAEVGQPSGVASLDGTGKIPVSQLPTTVLEYQGSWNPSTNTPTLNDSTGTNGYVYYVSTAFSGTVSGLTDPSMFNFQVGDLVIYSSTVGKWQLNSPANGVQSVNGAQGVVIVNAINQLTGDVAAGPASGSQSQAATIQANVVSNSKLAQMPGDTLKGNNTGTTANAADLTVAQVTAMIGVTTATASSLAERDASGNLYANQMNAQAASGPQIRMSDDGTNWLEEQYVDVITLLNNQASAVAVDPSTTFAIASYAGFQMDYYMADGSSPTLTRMGTVTVTCASDGSIVSITDANTFTQDIGVVFTAVLNGANVELRYTSTNTSNRTMRAKIRRFRV